MANTLPGKTEKNAPAAATQGDKTEGKPVTTSPAEMPLSFQDADDMPDAKVLNQSSNPFQEKVNELARTGKATSVVVPGDKGEWARTMIRRAANNINKGTRTKLQKVENDPTKVRVWFKVTKKVERTGTASS